MKLFRISLLAVCLLFGQATQAQSKLDLEDLLQMAWESSWGQSGAPLPVIKWTVPLKIRLQGNRVQLRQALVVQMLDEMAAITGHPYELIKDPRQAVQVTIDVVTDSPAVSDGMPCITSYQSDGSGLKSAQVTVRDRVIGRCLMHELGHMMGVPGHPMGNTVMTYFGALPVLTEYDKFLLQLRYSKALPHGSSPFTLVKVAGDHFIKSLDDDEQKDSARSQLTAFLEKIKTDMSAYALGEGEPPRVLFRAGRLKPEAVERGRITMQVFLGMSYLLGQLTPVDGPKAQTFFQMAAEQGHVGAQFMLGVVHRNSPLAHQWYACASRNGLAAAQQALVVLEKDVDAAQLESMRAQTKRFQEQGLCKLQAPAS